MLLSRLSPINNLFKLELRSFFHKEVTMTTLPVIFHNFDSIKSFLNQPEYRTLEVVEKLWNVHKEAKYSNQEVGENRRYPLIVFEGLDGSGKTTITSELSSKINATLLYTPPTCLHSLRHLFDESKSLRTAYYCLGNYIAAEEIKVLLLQKPVVLDRFWHSTAAFSLAQAVANDPVNCALPPKGDKVYCWPKDLLKPDKVIFLNVSEEVRLKRHMRRNTANTAQENLLKVNNQFRQNVVKAYENMYNPGVEIVNGDPSVKEVVECVFDKIKHILPK